MLENELIVAYTNTNYKVFNPKFVIKVGQTNPELNKLLEETGNVHWAYITAFNPYSKELSLKENLLRQEELLAIVKKHDIYIGHGVDEKEIWEPENSVLIIGITATEAIKLGNKYEQNAIVLGSIYKKAILKVLI